PARWAARPLRHPRQACAPARGGRLHARADRRAYRGRRDGTARLARLSRGFGGTKPRGTAPQHPPAGPAVSSIGAARYRVAPMSRVRLDSLLAQRGLFESRSRAAAAVLAGSVHLGSGRRRAEKPGQLVDPAVEFAVDAPPPFVSRAGIKL